MSLTNPDKPENTGATGDQRRAFEQKEKEDRASELEEANKELAYQNEQKEKRAQELAVANAELAYQNEQKEKRAAELAVANRELAYQSEQKEKRAAELVIANKELAYQNKQKERRAQELIIANKELAYQNEQKEKRAAELELANIELAYQNEQKEKRAAELAEAIKDLEAFAYVSSHHLQEPLRKIRSFVDRVRERDAKSLSEKGKHDLERIDVATSRMSQLIQAVYTYSRINVTDPAYEHVSVSSMIEDVTKDLDDRLKEKEAVLVTDVSLEIDVIPAQFRQIIFQLLDNGLKFSKAGVPPQIIISGDVMNGTDAAPESSNPGERYCCIRIKDNGIGFDPRFNEAIFGIFQRLHPVEEYPGTGIGLAIVKKVMVRHKGFVTAAGEPGAGATFRLYFPME